MTFGNGANLGYGASILRPARRPYLSGELLPRRPPAVGARRLERQRLRHLYRVRLQVRPHSTWALDAMTHRADGALGRPCRRLGKCRLEPGDSTLALGVPLPPRRDVAHERPESVRHTMVIEHERCLR